MRLVAHPGHPPVAASAVSVEADLRRGPSVLTYRVAGELAAMPVAEAVRTDGLWRHSCFELFVKPEGGAEYFEFNFARSGAWAAYRLGGYRADLAELPIVAPVIERLEDGVRVSVDLSGLGDGAWRVGISAVIEEPDGTISYWALAHPDGKADFHDPACFALEL